MLWMHFFISRKQFSFILVFYRDDSIFWFLNYLDSSFCSWSSFLTCKSPVYGIKDNRVWTRAIELICEGAMQWNKGLHFKVMFILTFLCSISLSLYLYSNQWIELPKVFYCNSKTENQRHMRLLFSSDYAHKT